MENEKDFDPVIDALQERMEALWNLTQSNINLGMFNVMDQIRLQHMKELEQAIQLWENRAKFGIYLK
jgi:hypothetical protein